MIKSLLSAAVAVGLIAGIAAPAFAHHDDWHDGDRHEHEWREREWHEHERRDRDWHDHEWREHHPYYTAPPMIEAPPAAYYAPPPIFAPAPIGGGINIIVPVHIR
jgi:hypothetical protein